jgi:hypothetical protein
VAIVALVLSFVVKADSIALYALGGAISLGLMALHAWPTQRVIAKVQERLDSSGGRSDLASVLTGSPT